jgi:preprotein translocase subunit SecG
MIIALITLHVVFCLFIVLFVLLHRGSGGGLSDMFGGGGGSLGGSAVVEKNLDRITVVAIVGALVTSILLVRLL